MSHVQYSVEVMLEILTHKGMRRYPKSDAFMSTSECVKKKKKTRGGKKVREKMLKRQQKEAEAAAAALANGTAVMEEKEDFTVVAKPRTGQRHASNVGVVGVDKDKLQPKSKKMRAASSASDSVPAHPQTLAKPTTNSANSSKRGSLVTTSLSAAAEAAAASVAHLGHVEPGEPSKRSKSSQSRKGSNESPKNRRHKSAPPKKLGKHFSHDLELKQEAEMSKALVSILNKLTVAKFDKLAGMFADELLKNVPAFVKIMTFPGEELSEARHAELQSKSAQRVIKVSVSHIFDKALKESSFCSLYARLCKFLNEHAQLTLMSTGVDGVRKCVIWQCQREFEMALENAKKLHNVGSAELEISSQYPAAAKLRMVGNIRFVAELFLVNQVSTNVIMHVIGVILTRSLESKKSLGIFFEEELETLCVLIRSAGKAIDTPSNQTRLNQFFDLLGKLSVDQQICSRIRFAIQDVLDLRGQHWETRKKNHTSSPFDKELALKLQLKPNQSSKKGKKNLMPKTSSTPKGTSSGSSAANLTFVSALDKNASLALMKAKSAFGQSSAAELPRTATAESSGRFSFGHIPPEKTEKKKRTDVPFPAPGPVKLVKAMTEAPPSRMSLQIDAGGSTPREIDDSKSTSSGTSVESLGAEAVLKKHVDKIVEELFFSYEMKEALQCVDEIPADSFDQNFAIRNIEIVGTILLTSMEKSDKERKLTVEFLVNFCARKEVERIEVEKG
jgi:hypothetical protein